MISISSEGSITYSPSNVNLAVIPDDWSLTYGSGPQIIYLDYSVTHNGHVSIRLEPHTANDVNTARECDGTWYAVKLGDHIVAKCWMKIDDNGDRDPYSGARIGIDLYNQQNGHNYLLYGIQGPTYPTTSEGERDNYVGWGTVGWVQRTIDFIIPSTYFTYDYLSGQTIPPTQVSSIVMWMQVWSGTYGGTEQGNAWFADAELYINP
jgi:hypothetical protein